MAKRNKEPIKTMAFVRINGAEYNMDELTPRQKSAVSNQLNLQLCQAVYGNSNVKFYIRKGCPTIQDSFPTGD